MNHLLYSTFRAVRSLFAPGMFSLIVVSVAATIATLIAFVIVMSAFFTYAASAHPALAWVGTVGSIVLAWFLFPGIMPIIVSFFDQRIVTIIERADYPHAMPLANPPFWKEFWHDARFSFTTLLLNILALPFYIFLPFLAPILFYWLNGYLLGREFFVMAARRHIPVEQAEQLRRRYSRSITLAGVALAVLATIPIANLIAPFWGIAAMTHLYHRLAA